MCGVIAVVMCLAVSRAEASETLKAVVGSYLELQTLLAADKIDGLPSAAQSIALHAAQIGSAGEAIAKAVGAVEAAADLKAAREAFGPLSDAVIAAAKAAGWADLRDVKVAYCPMAKRSWLQKGDRIRNPYYGSTMLECGEFKTR
jgi:hypothetical protein